MGYDSARDAAAKAILNYEQEVYASPLGHVSIEAMEQKSIIAQSSGSNQSGALHHHLDLKMENS